MALGLGHIRKADGQVPAEPQAARRREPTPAKGLAAHFKREVPPDASDAWIDHDKTRVGYEIPFHRTSIAQSRFRNNVPSASYAIPMPVPKQAPGAFTLFLNRSSEPPREAIDAQLTGVTNRIKAMIAGLMA